MDNPRLNQTLPVPVIAANNANIDNLRQQANPIYARGNANVKTGPRPATKFYRQVNSTLTAENLRSRDRGDFKSDPKLRTVESTTSIDSSLSVASSVSCTSDEINKLLTWLQSVPLTKSMKHINRDFSDGVLLAQLIAHFFPKMLELHNYAPANKASLKKNNWEVLNRKVLPKLGIRLTDSTIEAICLTKPNYIEPILCQIRKLIFRKCEQNEMIKTQELANSAGDHVAPVLETASCLVHILPSDATEYVIFRGIKFYPEELLNEKQQANMELKGKLKELTGKVQRLETLVGLKESHLMDLTNQLHELKMKLGEIKRDSVRKWSAEGPAGNNSPTFN